MLSFKPAFPLSSFTFIKKLFSSYSLTAIRLVSSAYLELLLFLPAILIPACASYSLAFHVMYSACKLKGKGDKGQVIWYSYLFKNFPQFVVIHTVKGFSIVNEAKIDISQELFCFFDDSADVSNLICGSSALSKSSFDIWKFIVHVLLKPGLENLEHYFASM